MSTTEPIKINLSHALSNGQPWPGPRDAVVAELARNDVAARSDHLAGMVSELATVNREWKLEAGLRVIQSAAVRYGVDIITAKEA